MRRFASVAVATMLLMGLHNALGVSAGDPKDTPAGLDIASSSIRTLAIAGAFPHTPGGVDL